jgi:hypothetical protein
LVLGELDLVLCEGDDGSAWVGGEVALGEELAVDGRQRMAMSFLKEREEVGAEGEELREFGDVVCGLR